MRAAPIAIAGAGGLGRELLVLIQQINQTLPTWQMIGFYDDDPDLKKKDVNDYPCLGNLEELADSKGPVSVILAIGNPEVKRKLYEKLRKNQMLDFPALVHPSVNLQPFQKIHIGQGSIITAGCQLTTNIKVGHFVLLNLNCTVGHDAVLGDYSSFMPGVHVSGEAKVGNACYLGTGAVVLNKVQIGDGAVVGAGAVTVSNIPSGIKVVGIPARPISTP